MEDADGKGRGYAGTCSWKRAAVRAGATPLTGFWTGQWHNSYDASGPSSLCLVERDGKLVGDWGGSLIDATVKGDEARWSFRGADVCTDYVVRLVHAPGARTATLHYAATNGCTKVSYTGMAVFERVGP